MCGDALKEFLYSTEHCIAPRRTSICLGSCRNNIRNQLTVASLCTFDHNVSVFALSPNSDKLYSLP